MTSLPRSFPSRVLCAVLLSPLVALANPLDPQVISGQAQFQALGKQLDIRNTPGAIINWNGFSIGAGEITRFIQQSASSAVLNRVVGQDPSRILGALLSNGRVFLINPNGIVFGAGAQINTAGLVASTLNLSNQDFSAGRLRFTGDATSGSIDNAAVINTAQGGQVYLIAPRISNSGLINAPNGQILLAAGRSVALLDPESPNLSVEISAPGTQVLNLGQLIANSGRIGIYAPLIDQRGSINADSAVQTASGQIVLRTSGDIHLRDASQVSASGASDSQQAGGKVQIVAGGKLDLASGAQVKVDGGGLGGDGGSLELSGAQLALAGNYSGTAHAPGYVNGALLLDPEYINLISGGYDSIPASGIIDSASSPAINSLNIDPIILANGPWSAIQLAATLDINVASPILNLGAVRNFSLSAGRDLNLTANLGSASAALPSDVTLTAGRQINLASAVYLGSGNTLTLNGITQVNSASLLSAGQVQVGTLGLDNAPLTLAAPTHIGTLNLSGNKLDNQQPLTIDTLNWRGGVLQATQPVNVSTLLAISGSPTLIGGSLTSHGIATLAAGANLTLDQGAQLTNATGARFLINDTAAYGGHGSQHSISQGNAPSASFINQGSLQNTSDSSVTRIGVNFINSGTVQTDAGLLDLAGSTSGSGLFTTASGATLMFFGSASLPSPANLIGGSVIFSPGSQVYFSPVASSLLGTSTLIPVSGGKGPLFLGAITQPLHGSVVNNHNGTLSYIPASSFTGTDRFSYLLSAAGGSASAQQTVQVGTSQPPIPVDNNLITQTNNLTNESRLNDTERRNHNASSSCN
jgi:filamentous hemagglutinin family protein